MSNWSHGYYTHVPYTFGYYRETDPRWLDFAALLSGHWPPVATAERPLRYLDLGCGQGLGLCVAAALHPEMEFVGIDFNPTHIVHARDLARRAGLVNLRFLEADFVELGEDWPADLGQFDYVVLHGIWSWIAPTVRAGAVAALKQCLVPGGLVYNSYNAQPGWHAGSILRELLMTVTNAETDQNAMEALRRAIRVAQQLQDAGALVFRAYPGLGQRLQTLGKHDLRYVANEYINEEHAIFWGHEVAAEMAPAKLSLVSSATLPENFLPALLPPEQAKMVNRFSQPAIRNLLIDLAINQGFRRDLYQRGVVQAPRFPMLERVMATRVLGLRAEKREPKFGLSFGEVNGREEMYGPLLDLIDAEPMTLSELQARHPLKPNVSQLAQAISIGAWDNRLAFAAPAGSGERALAFNVAVMQAQREGRFYNWLAAPATCQAIAIPPLDILVLAAIRLDGIAPGDVAQLVATVWSDVERLELNVTKEEQALNGEAKRAEVERQVREALEKRLPLWAHLAIV